LIRGRGKIVSKRDSRLPKNLFGEQVVPLRHPVYGASFSLTLLLLLSRQQVAQVYFTEMAESYRQSIGGIAWLRGLRQSKL
jgi:hypothetical protein